MEARTAGASGDTITLGDETELAVDAVIWATGFDLDHSWIELPVRAADGGIFHRRGVTDIPGLYFLGLPWQHTRGSALLGWVKDDAEYIAAQIAMSPIVASTSLEVAVRAAGDGAQVGVALRAGERRDVAAQIATSPPPLATRPGRRGTVSRASVTESAISATTPPSGETVPPTIETTPARGATWPATSGT